LAGRARRDRFEELDRALVRLLYRREAGLDRKAGPLPRLERARDALLRRAVRPPSLRRPERLILLITHRCQLRCGYCRVRKFGKDMSKPAVRRAVRLLFTSSRQAVQLQFFGGEPLLRPDLVRLGTREAEARGRETGKEIRFLLTTNGIALDKAMLRFMRGRSFTVEFSCDGTMATQEGQRRPRGGGARLQARIRENLEALRGSRIPYYVIAVTTPENVDRLPDDFMHLARSGHRRIQVNYCLGRVWSPDKARRLLEGLARIRAWASRRPGLEFVNATELRREPVVLNSELTVDCDGGIYRETGICLEEDFSRAKRDFFVSRLEDAGHLDALGRTPFDNFKLLARIYGKRDPSWREVIVNNVRLGWTVDRWLRGTSG